MKQTPLICYQYYAWHVKDYDDWARQAAEQKDGMLEYERTIHLEQIYSNEKVYSAEEHADNIQWLIDLEHNLAHIWTHRQKTEAGMGHLVEDYKTYFELT